MIDSVEGNAFIILKLVPWPAWTFAEIYSYHIVPQIGLAPRVALSLQYSIATPKSNILDQVHQWYFSTDI